MPEYGTCCPWIMLMAASQCIHLLRHDMSNKYSLIPPCFANFTLLNIQGNSGEELARTKTEYDAFLADGKNLQTVRQALQDPNLTAEQKHVLKCMEKTFACYITEDPRIASLKASRY